MNEPTLRQLSSKKNNVFRARDVVIKTFTDPSRFQTERKMGNLLENAGLLIPGRISVNEENWVIVYTYIDGSPVVDLIESTSLSQAEEIIRKICAWLVNFYAITLKKLGCQYILGDIHLRNFIYEEASKQVYGFDFEECRPGKIETDVARFYVFMLYYDPAFTPRKKTLAAYFWETISASLRLDESFFQDEVKRETKELLARRRLNRLIPSSSLCK